MAGIFPAIYLQLWVIESAQTAFVALTSYRKNGLSGQ